MKVVILAGGMGTRLAEETEVRPKPMVEIGGRPILWHIMKHYAHYGFREFYIALGYKGEVIKRYFLDYHGLSSNMTVTLQSGQIEVIDSHPEDWVVHLVDTGLQTATGGRVKRLQPWLQDEPFLLTYGDGVSNINLHKLIDAHRSWQSVATLSAVRPPARFGSMIFDGDRVSEFTEKPQIGEGWINGGFLVLEPAIFEYLRSESASLESDVLDQLARERQLTAYRHDGFWQCMDTVRDKRLLETLWQSGNPPWEVW